MENSFFVLMNLAEKSANLHVRFALVLDHFESERRLSRVVEVRLQVVTLQVVKTGFQAEGALFKDPQLLVAHAHVVQSQEVNELVLGSFVGLNLFQHRLRFLQQNQGLFVALLRNEVDGTFVQLVNDNRYLICRN